MLSRKYYIMLARVIKDNSELINDTIVDVDGIKSIVINKDSFINDLSNELKKDNINFNYSRFEEACNE